MLVVHCRINALVHLCNGGLLVFSKPRPYIYLSGCVNDSYLQTVLELVH